MGRSTWFVRAGVVHEIISMVTHQKLSDIATVGARAVAFEGNSWSIPDVSPGQSERTERVTGAGVSQRTDRRDTMDLT